MWGAWRRGYRREDHCSVGKTLPRTSFPSEQDTSLPFASEMAAEVLTEAWADTGLAITPSLGELIFVSAVPNRGHIGGQKKNCIKERGRAHC